MLDWVRKEARIWRSRRGISGLLGTIWMRPEASLTQWRAVTAIVLRWRPFSSSICFCRWQSTVAPLVIRLFMVFLPRSAIEALP